MTTVLAIDPGFRNCGIVVLQHGVPVFFTGFMGFTDGDVFERSMHITRMLQSIAIRYKVNCWGTEKFFGGKGKATNYGRGILDGVTKVGLASYPSFTAHPGHLKRWVTGRGNATKDLMEEKSVQKAREESPEFYQALLKKFPMDMEHILDAYFIGMITHHIYQSRYVSSDLPRDRKMLLRSFESQEKIQPAHSDHFATLPSRTHQV